MTDMHKAIVVSSDTYFYSLGPEIGVNALHDFTKQFGFGQITGIDLEGESAACCRPPTGSARPTRKTPALVRGRDHLGRRGPGLQLVHAAAVGAGHVDTERRPVPAAPGARCAIRTGQPPIRCPTIASPEAGQRRRDQERDGRRGARRHGATRSPTRPTRRPARPARRRCSACEARYRASAIDERLRDHALGFARRWSTRASPWR